MNNVEKINEYNKLTLNKPLDSDRVYYSELNEWYTTNAFRSFSLKYVIDQSIYYKVDGTEHKVDSRHYMLACKQDDVNAYFNSRQMVRSICIDICPASFTDAFNVLTGKGDDIDEFMYGYFRFPEFYEHIYAINNEPLGQKLQQLLALIQYNQLQLVDREWFLDLIEMIIAKEYGNYLLLKNIRSVKPSTRKEILRRLQMAKDYMDAYFLTIEEMKTIAQACSMSEFHFFRNFKQVYQQSPFKYITARKMEMAESLLKKNTRLADVAFTCNYPDTFTFSKAFKRYFGYAPSTLLRSNELSSF